MKFGALVCFFIFDSYRTELAENQSLSKAWSKIPKKLASGIIPEKVDYSKQVSWK